MNLRCPICQDELTLDAACATCPQHHTFDRAREGYWNLLPAQHKKSANPGDSKAMLQARKRFLEAGFYQPLIDELRTRIIGGTLLDLGCGEGYYARSLGAASGIDISKDGVRLAAKADKTGVYTVGSAYRLPYLDDQFNHVLCVFSPIDLDEVQRVLKPGGQLHWVGPAPAHLNQLAAMVYDEVQTHQATPPESLKGLPRTSLKFDMQMDGPILADLLCMTPYYWSADEAKQTAIARAPNTQVTASFEVLSCSLAAASSNASN